MTNLAAGDTSVGATPAQGDDMHPRLSELLEAFLRADDDKERSKRVDALRDALWSRSVEHLIRRAERHQPVARLRTGTCVTVVFMAPGATGGERSRALPPRDGGHERGRGGGGEQPLHASRV